METVKPYIRHESRYNYLMGVMVFGPWALPLWIPVSLYGVLLGLTFVGGFVVGIIYNLPDLSSLIPFALLLCLGLVVGGIYGVYVLFSAMRASIREVNGKDRY